jgi:acetylglutamate kinase
MSVTPDHTQLLAQAKILAEALPNLRQHSGSNFVIKYGGNALKGAQDSGSAMLDFARDIVLLKQVGINPVVVHGGGPQIGAMLERLQIKSQFIDGLRVTDAATIEIVEMVLAGGINKHLVQAIHQAGGVAVGLSGKDGNLITARKMLRAASAGEETPEKLIDLGFVGEPDRINPHVLHVLQQSDIIPVIAPVGVAADGMTYNINADTAAGAIAGALQAKRFVLLTDVPGVLDKNKQLLPKLTFADIDRLIADGTISGGMIPKVETCRAAVQAGVEGAVIIDGRAPHALLVELFTDHGAGTLITRD